MKPERFDEGRFEYGEAVRVTRNVRNDGTYPGLDVGHLLVRRGSLGNVVEVGTFLQDQVIFTVHFLSQGRMVGCRLEELISADEVWNPSRFEFRDKVVCTLDLGVQGNVLVAKGSDGEVMKVIRDDARIQYHVAFHARTLQVPESALAPAHPETFCEPEF
ncbi:nitrogen fixation protein NifZ [Methylovulum psychrotolerans]|jgi:nitrogen fixation protein NifZ|uniref:Nitrogen fixation protein NifZ n=1 Tax=Methylovulum psychrotolerans TaxID=1704499 RepID=A0A1Z4C377_9GAMM|nr:nitrogen fixation protein NifZ [Methylovulum psychrotolerans]ASF47971.1 nitrogen fixation protein NifZ [Methylovulum psychrotolerans]MBT9099637.1 nitrogen fixation protein NifZ [Methylovulum psychrotolerans]POZ50253.1 nitrogen fixation protein NifZ [Methylovulum psychrotolerans]